MWWKQGQKKTVQHLSRKKHSVFLDDEYQLRFCYKMLAFVLGAYVLVSGVSYYFVQQNMNLFISLAYEQAPEILDNLEFEKTWLASLFFTSALVLAVYLCLFSYWITTGLIRPVFKIKKHLHKLSRGDWTQPEVQIQTQHDYEDLIQAYNYFYRSLQKQSWQELEELKKMKVSIMASDSRDIWRRIIEQKSEQLIGVPEDVSQLDTKKIDISDKAI